MESIKQLITRGQNVSLEFISHIENQLAITRTVVAFANTNGGKVIVGINEKNKIVGVEPTEELKLLKELISNDCMPAVPFESKVIEDGRHLLLEIDIPKSNSKHKAKGEDGEMKFYHRIKDTTLVGNRVIINLWKLQDESTPKPIDLDDNLKAIFEFIEEHKPVTVSKIFRFFALNKNDINLYLAQLNYWEYIDCVIVESGMAYTLAN
ncbi:MAG: putative HTH transcriptional regulator [Crocinitomicaceae bacterium]|jgi:predicted HTH transcriptional regulator